MRALAGIKDALILQHSVVGCQWGSLTFRYAGKPYDVRQASDVIYDEDVVNGTRPPQAFHAKAPGYSESDLEELMEEEGLL